MILCSYTLSELGLGHLIGQSAQGAQRGAWRGAGFEASTAGWASVRAGKGLLISTSARAGTYGSAQSTQMDATEALVQLRSAKDLGQRLSNAAAQSQAQALHSLQGGNSLERFMAQIDPAQQGKLGDPLNGQSALHDPQGSRDLKEPVHAFGAPVMVLDTPSSAALTSQTQVLAYAGEGLGFVSQGDVQHSAAHTASQVSGQTTSFFTHAGGLQVKAADGPLGQLLQLVKEVRDQANTQLAKVLKPVQLRWTKFRGAWGLRQTITVLPESRGNSIPTDPA